jgi:hypothetical protein
MTTEEVKSMRCCPSLLHMHRSLGMHNPRLPSMMLAGLHQAQQLVDLTSREYPKLWIEELITISFHQTRLPFATADAHPL